MAWYNTPFDSLNVFKPQRIPIPFLYGETMVCLLLVNLIIKVCHIWNILYLITCDLLFLPRITKLWLKSVHERVVASNRRSHGYNQFSMFKPHINYHKIPSSSYCNRCQLLPSLILPTGSNLPFPHLFIMVWPLLQPWLVKSQAVSWYIIEFLTFRNHKLLLKSWKMEP